MNDNDDLDAKPPRGGGPKRIVRMKGPLGVEDVEAIEISEHLGVIHDTAKGEIDAVTREIKKTPPGYSVVLLRWGVGISGRAGTPYEAVAYANFIKDRLDWAAALDDPPATQRTLRALRAEWDSLGGWLGKEHERALQRG